MRLTALRLLPAALVLVLTGCSGNSDEPGSASPSPDSSTGSSTGSSASPSSTPSEASGDPAAGIVAESDLPFEPTSADDIGRAGPLSAATSSCLGTELEVLYDEGWTVAAREYSDAKEWDVTSAVITPPEGAPDAGIDLVRARAEECRGKEQQAKVKPLQLGGASYGYQINDEAGGFDSARAYLRLEGGKLAQITVGSMPAGQRATEVLKGLLAALVK